MVNRNQEISHAFQNGLWIPFRDSALHLCGGLRIDVTGGKCLLTCYGGRPLSIAIPKAVIATMQART
jgi:hypothetical protein